MHPPMKPMTTRMPDVSATGSEMNDADISANLSPSGISQRSRLSRQPGAHYPRTVPHVYHHDSASGSGDTRGQSHHQAGGRCLLHGVDNRVTQAPPLRTHEPRHHKATSRSPADGGRNHSRGEQPQNPNRFRASAGGPSQGGNSSGGAGGSRGGASHGDAAGGGSSGGSSSHGAGRRAGGGGDRGGRGHANSHVSGTSRSG
jgi:hypothetical protein